MELKKLHMGTIVFGWEAMDEVNHLLAQTFGDVTPNGKLKGTDLSKNLR